MSVLTFRSIFISDVHMGTKSCKATYLLDFLRSTECENLYLVGDIFDLWAMRKSVYWTHAQTQVLQEVFAKAKSGTNVIYIPGNHDSTFREFAGTTMHNIRIQLNVIHKTPDGKRLFVSHGDEFDMAVKHNKVLRFIGDYAYYLLLRLNHINTYIRQTLKLPYWSLSSHIKSQVRNANEYIEKYEQAALNKAKYSGYDGYVCGHIHKSGITNKNDTLYCNTGDWVEHCTALVEDAQGVLKVLHWSDHAKVQIINHDDGVVYPDMSLPLPAPGSI
ncbi:MAG: UDP-2,3-diacylglucosamine diphosphatase [Thiolinea sp.]